MALEQPVLPATSELVLRARGGDRAAFDELYRTFVRSVHGVLLARLPAADADEATHEVFVMAHARLEQLRDPAALGPWLHALARNVANDWHRTRGRQPRSLEHAAAVPAKDATRNPTHEEELRGRVLHHVLGLPEAYRETLLLRLVEGLTGPEIAAQTGLEPGSVRVNLHRGLELLRPLLAKEGWP